MAKKQNTTETETVTETAEATPETIVAETPAEVYPKVETKITVDVSMEGDNGFVLKADTLKIARAMRDQMILNGYTAVIYMKKTVEKIID